MHDIYPIDRHEVTVTIFFVHCLLNKVRVFVETFRISTSDHLKLVAQRLCEHQFCRTTIEQYPLYIIVVLNRDVWADCDYHIDRGIRDTGG